MRDALEGLGIRADDMLRCCDLVFFECAFDPEMIDYSQRGSRNDWRVIRLEDGSIAVKILYFCVPDGSSSFIVIGAGDDRVSFVSSR